jgi:predicted small lipoprotein YifL
MAASHFRLFGTICYGRVDSRGICVNLTLHRSLTRLAMLGALVAALGLSACGRKAGLDPPPATAAAVPAEETAVGQRPEALGTDSQGKPVAAATAQRKRFFLDFLLD